VDGLPGAAVEADLLERLGIALGEEIRIGEQSFQVRATIAREPDRTASAFTFGPRVLIALDGLAATGLDGPGSLVYRHLRVDLAESESLPAWRARLDKAFPEAGWRVAGLDRAAPGVERFIGQVRLFMSLVGLTALLVGGVGVANGVAAHLESRRDTIATLKCLGASGGLVARIYFLQVLSLAGIGIAIGLAIGALAPVLLAPLLAESFNLNLGGAPSLWPLLLAALMGFLTAALFALRPLARAETLSAAGLFRGHLEQRGQRLPRWFWWGAALCGLLLAFLAIATHQDKLFAAGFVAGAVVTLAAFRLAATGVMALARRLPRPRRTSWRLALANLHRPGAPTPSVVISLGLGLTVLAAVALIQANISRQVLQEIPAEAPTFYFIDLQNEQVEQFDAMVREHPGVGETNRVPMLRGRITAIDGTPTDQLTIPPNVAWIFRSDRGLTWAREQPEGVALTQGQWWPADYAGPPLVSLDQEIGQGLGLSLGDTVTVNVYGRDVTAEIASFRPIEWAELRINFVMIFSPGLLESAPASHIATVRVDDANAGALERAVTDAFPNVSAIRVAEALSGFAELLDSIAAAVGGTGSVTVLAGLIVLAGAVAAGERRRRYEAVVLKVLGATRRLLLGALGLEFALLGLATAAIAAVLGAVAAAIIVELVMEQNFTLLAGPLLWTLAAGLAVTLLFGLAGTARALGARAAPLLRNE
jgi:putative ABC transport system permease protein